MTLTFPMPRLLLTLITKIGGLNDIMKLTPMETLAILLATACHDVGHPGVNNKFLCATNDKTAIQVLGSAVGLCSAITRPPASLWM